MKYCNKCDSKKAKIEFGSNTSSGDGLSAYCLSCNRTIHSARREKLRNDNKNHFVYGLLHPLTQEMRYIGVTRILTRRLQQHLKPKALEAKTRKNSWIKSLLKDNLIPEIIQLEMYDTIQEAYAAEIELIEYFKNIGVNLTNGTSGGEGRKNPSVSQETRDKISKTNTGRKVTEEAKKNMSIAQSKRASSGMKGKHHTDDTKARISKANVGKHPNEKTKEKLRLSKTGVNSPWYNKPMHNRKITFEKAEEIREFYKNNSKTLKEVSEIFDTHKSSVFRIVKNTYYKI